MMNAFARARRWTEILSEDGHTPLGDRDIERALERARRKLEPCLREKLGKSATRWLESSYGQNAIGHIAGYLATSGYRFRQGRYREAKKLMKSANTITVLACLTLAKIALLSRAAKAGLWGTPKSELDA